MEDRSCRKNNTRAEALFLLCLMANPFIACNKLLLRLPMMHCMVWASTRMALLTIETTRNFFGRIIPRLQFPCWCQAKIMEYFGIMLHLQQLVMYALFNHYRH